MHLRVLKNKAIYKCSLYEKEGNSEFSRPINMVKTFEMDIILSLVDVSTP